MLVHESVADRFTELVVEKPAWSYGNPADPSVDMGTVIDEAAAKFCEQQVNDAIARGRGCWSATSATARCIRRR